MSDMLKGLTQLSREAGANAAEALASAASVESMEQRISRGVRRRRQRTGALAAVAVLIAGAGAIITPQLVDDVDLPAVPAVGPEIVGSHDSLTVYADGSMSVITVDGQLVRLPAPEGESPVDFTFGGFKDTCGQIDVDNFPLGWEYANESAQSLLAFGRPQEVMLDGTLRNLAQGGSTVTGYDSAWPSFAFQLDADPGVAPHVALRATAFIVDENGPYGFTSQLSAEPHVTYLGGEGLGPQVAQVQTYGLTDPAYCREQSFASTPATAYLVVDVFVTDREGNTTWLATHRSSFPIEPTSGPKSTDSTE